MHHAVHNVVAGRGQGLSGQPAGLAKAVVARKRPNRSLHVDLGDWPICARGSTRRALVPTCIGRVTDRRT